MAGHALLSPSSASQWLTCTISPRFCEGVVDTSSEFADEGTLAHAYGETYLENHTDKEALAKALKALENHKHYAKHYSEELRQHGEDFADYVLQQCTGDYVLEIEQKLDLRAWVPEGFGTGDAIVVKDKVLNLNDLKYGRGVKVSSVDNKQLMIYGLGCIEKYGWIYQFDTIRLHIYQPRLNNISVWSITVEELLKWAEEVLKPRAKMAYDGVGEAVPGEHCRFCKRKAECKAFADLSFGFTREDLAQPNQLTIEEIAELYPKISLVEMHLKAVKEYVYAKLLSGGEVPGFKMVKGKPSRVFKSDSDIKQVLLDKGYAEDDILTPPKPRALLPLTGIEKLLKKKTFTEVLGDHIEIKHSQPAVAPVTDPREEYSEIENVFGDELLDENWMG